MKKAIYLVSVCSVLICAASVFIYRASGSDIVYSAGVTAGTVAYHFLMRLSVGYVIDRNMKNRADYNSGRFRCRKWEERLYKRLKVRKWKNRLPTFVPGYFDPSAHSWDEIAQAMCQSETVHEVIAVLSFVPIAFSVKFGALPVFVITSILSAGFDMLFVIVQRYNRPRIIRMIETDRRRERSGE